MRQPVGDRALLVTGHVGVILERRNPTNRHSFVYGSPCGPTAETETGEWILIEINDGQTAVPSENDLDELYGNLSDALRAFN